MPKLFVIPGHGAGDPGAGGYGYSEAERVRTLATIMKALAPDDVILSDFNRNYYADKGITTMVLPANTVILELHMDSSDSTSAKGGHVIIKEGYQPDQYDKKLAANISKLFPGRSQTIVGRANLGNVNRAAARGFNYRLVEVCFISNRNDLDKFNSSLDEIARAILDAFDIKVKAAEPLVIHSVKTAHLNSTNEQLWFLRGKLEDGAELSIRNVGNYLWLSDPGSSKVQTNAQVWEGQGGDDGNADPREPQVFILHQIRLGDEAIVWELAPKVAPNLRLDITGASTDVNATVQWYPKNNTDAQRFIFFSVGGKKYRIISCSGFLPIAVA